MRIRVQIAAAVAVSLLAGLASLAGVMVVARQSDAAGEAQRRAQVTAHEVAGLLTLTQEYARYAEPRAAQQWHQRHATIVQTLGEGRAGSIQGVAFTELGQVVTALPLLFQKLESLPPGADGFAARRKEMLVDQLLTSTQAMSDFAYQWFLDASQVKARADEQFRIVAFFVPGVLLVFLCGVALLVRQRVLVPLTRLDAAARALGAGEMGHRIGSTERNELGDLARQFDSMSGALAESRERLQRSEQQLRAVTDNLPVLISYIDQDQRYRFVNRTFREWMGIDPAAALGRHKAELMPGAPYGQRMPYLERALAGERVTFELETELLGVTRYLQSTYVPDIQPDGRVVGVYMLSTDVSALKKVELQLSELVRVDTLTGLANRYQFNEVLPMALRRGERAGTGVALMFLDVDHFKQINDTHGHLVGDQVLQQFAERLRQCVRATDTVARLAGDEFLVLLEGLRSEAEPELVAQKILAAMAAPLVLDGGERLQLGTSVGVAYCAPGKSLLSVAELMAHADKALYVAKRSGRNTYRFAQELA